MSINHNYQQKTRKESDLNGEGGLDPKIPSCIAHGNQIFPGHFRFYHVRRTDQNTALRTANAQITPHGFAYLVWCTKRQKLLRTDRPPVRKPPGGPYMNLAEIHTFRLYGIENIHANLDQIIQKW